MFHIEMSDEEQKLLAEILETSLTTLELEIHRTDSHDFRDLLQHRHALLKRVQAKVGEPAQVVA